MRMMFLKPAYADVFAAGKAATADAIVGVVVVAVTVAAACLLAACDPASTPEETAWYGLVRNDCGPADGAAVTFQLDTAAYAGCESRHTGEISTQLQDFGYIDSLKVGHVFADTQTICPVDKCLNRTVITIEILAADSATVTTGVRIESRSGEGPASIRAGKALLKKCRVRPLCG